MGISSHLEIVKRLLTRSGFPGHAASPDLFRITGDGSDRLFYRLTVRGYRLVAVFPASEKVWGLKEARSSYLIGRHLHEQGVPVPEAYAHDTETGVILFEDCGDAHLHDALLREEYVPYIRDLYHKAIDGLILFQVQGEKGFDPGFCWDTPKYDRDLMLTRESGYFLSSFCHDYLGITAIDPGIAIDFERLARRAARLPCSYLLHRDFQSRNILVQQEHIRIIDFQGARYGPPGYDLASLLIDPYSCLGRERERELFAYYLSAMRQVIAVDEEEFRDGYYLLALQRNLQILGAFAYLSQIKEKLFFRDYINPALRKLDYLLQDSRGDDYPRLRELVSTICELTGPDI